MTTRTSRSCSAWVATLLIAGPAAGQLPFVPDHALPTSGGTASIYFAAGYARGANADSGKTDAFAATLGRSNEWMTVQAAGGYALSDIEEVLVGAAARVNFFDAGEPTQLGIQVGVGWVDFGDGRNILRYPFGIPLSFTLAGPISITPWVMPRADLQRTKTSRSSSTGTTFTTDTDTNFGTSAGLSITTGIGLGVNVAVDWLFSADGPDDSTITPLFFSVGSHFVFGR